jgi:GntR family transcriptional repressor for pyruvate dehydrogenase complex
MEGLLSNVMKIEKPDFFSLVETRIMMERFVVQQAAKNRTEKELNEIEKALIEYEIKRKNGSHAEQEDLNLHLKIIDASHNKVIKTLMLIILPDILSIYRKENICGDETTKDTLAEHRNILEAIKNKDMVMAEKYMMEHLKDVYEFSKSKVD